MNPSRLFPHAILDTSTLNALAAAASAQQAAAVAAIHRDPNSRGLLSTSRLLAAAGAKPDPGAELVYLNPTGTTYHQGGCGLVKDDATTRPLREVIAAGKKQARRACKRCFQAP